MILFFQKSNETPILRFPINGYKDLLIKNITPESNPTFEEIYISSTSEFNGHFGHMKKHFPEIEMFKVPEETIISDVSFPCMIGNIPNSKLFRSDLETIEAIEVLHKEKKRKLSIVIYSENKLALGDSLVQASVFKNLYDQVIAKGIDCEFVTYRSLSTQATQDNYFSIFPELKIRYLPTCLNNLRFADIVLTDSAYTLNFEDDMHDAFAKQMCFKLSDDFNPINSLKYDIIAYNKAKSLYANLFDNKNPVLAFNKESSSKLRSMPKLFAENMINKILDTGKFNIVSFDRHNFLDIKHDNYKILSSFTVETTDFFSFLAATDGLISVDSGPVHVAARVGIPSFSFYTSIDPKIREKYYKLADSVLIESDYMNQHTNEDLTEREIEDIWNKVDLDKTIKQITKKFKKKLFK